MNNNPHKTFKIYERHIYYLMKGLRSRSVISTIKPHKPASKTTIGHWIKLVLLKAGISQDFKPQIV